MTSLILFLKFPSHPIPFSLSTKFVKNLGNEMNRIFKYFANEFSSILSIQITI